MRPIPALAPPSAPLASAQDAAPGFDTALDTALDEGEQTLASTEAPSEETEPPLLNDSHPDGNEPPLDSPLKDTQLVDDRGTPVQPDEAPSPEGEAPIDPLVPEPQLDVPENGALVDLPRGEHVTEQVESQVDDHAANAAHPGLPEGLALLTAPPDGAPAPASVSPLASAHDAATPPPEAALPLQDELQPEPQTDAPSEESGLTEAFKFTETVRRPAAPPQAGSETAGSLTERPVTAPNRAETVPSDALPGAEAGDELLPPLPSETFRMGDKTLRVQVDANLAVEVGVSEDGIEVTVEGDAQALKELEGLENDLSQDLAQRHERGLARYTERRRSRLPHARPEEPAGSEPRGAESVPSEAPAAPIRRGHSVDVIA